MAYNHQEIDAKWQKHWEENGTFAAQDFSSKPKYFALDMFPYPSGHGLHIGHLASYTPTDIISRYKRAKGFNVLHPIGYDAFGLPAEQYAIQTGVHPAVTTQKAIDNFRRQLKSFGLSFDWTREVSTCEPGYYKGTQEIFLKLFAKGLAYQKEVPVNWCPALRTVLANEEVIDGKSERGGHPVVRLPMKQWMLKITAYAERLLQDLDKVDWPERTKEGQRNWIGKSRGAKLSFAVADQGSKIEVFTTRPDTLFGATFMVLAPEHPLVSSITTGTQKSAVDTYVKKSQARSEVERKAGLEKTGVFTGAYAINPVNNHNIPIWLADYVLMDYGTGAIMAVPGHDTRDFEFAQTFSLPVVRVLASDEELPFEGDGLLCNSDFLNGLGKAQAIDKMISYLSEKKIGSEEVQYRLRDWLFSRQRYWGEPFPIVEFPHHDLRAIPANELPVLLPEVADYEPSEKGEPPLARVHEWVNYRDAKTGEAGQRITDTMPGSAGSSWYFLRYTDPHNDKSFVGFEKQKYWMPVDFYLGGAEHTVGHLLYARFWQKVLFDAGLVSHDEPFQRLVHQGMVLGNDGEKMSKSRGNVINPDEVRTAYGSDAARMYIMFMGPLEKDKPWAENGIEGVRRFLDRVWRLVFDDTGKVIAVDTTLPAELEKVFHKTIKKVGDDIEALNFNTAISTMMILVNEIYKHQLKPKQVLKILAQLMMPFAPHLAEEIWLKLGGEDLVSLAPWPAYNPELIIDQVVKIGVQVNGKMRGTIEISPEASEDEALQMARQIASVTSALGEKEIRQVIYRKGRILNLIN